LLSPTEALGRFAPQSGLLRELGAGVEHERARYGYRSGGLSLLVRAGVGTEVLEQAQVAPLPGAAPWLVGLMNLRGLPLPVFDLRAALALPPGDASLAKPMVLVFDKGSDALGLRIDRLPRAVMGARTIAAPDALPPALAEFCGAAWLAQGEVWLEFDPQGFFAALAAA
jgi:twitching motility protein PilI